MEKAELDSVQTELELPEILEHETHVDMDKLVSLCKHGVPERFRSDAWKYLLGVSRPERSEEISQGKRMEQEFNELVKTSHAQTELARQVRAEVRKHRQQVGQMREASLEARTRQRLEDAMRCYLHAQGEECRPGLVHLLGPLAQVFSSEVDAYYTFQELMKRLTWPMSFEGCKQMTVTFMTLLRHTLPELYVFFEEEHCAGGAWLTSWLQFLLARELPLQCVLRLWDTYLAYHPTHSQEASLHQLHIYVCLAILEVCQEDIMELADAEVLRYLQQLPALDMEEIITQAFNIKDDVIARSLL